MVNYKDLGLANTREMFAKAVDGGYAIPAFNFNNMEQLQAIIQAAVETKSPVILQVSKGARAYANQTLLRYMAQGAVEYTKEQIYLINDIYRTLYNRGLNNTEAIQVIKEEYDDLPEKKIILDFIEKSVRSYFTDPYSLYFGQLSP